MMIWDSVFLTNLHYQYFTLDLLYLHMYITTADNRKEWPTVDKLFAQNQLCILHVLGTCR